MWRAQETAENRRFSHKTEDFCRKLQDSWKPQVELRHLRSVTLSSALKMTPHLGARKRFEIAAIATLWASKSRSHLVSGPLQTRLLQVERF